jgi:hypothetical protein
MRFYPGGRGNSWFIGSFVYGGAVPIIFQMKRQSGFSHLSGAGNNLYRDGAILQGFVQGRN